MAHMFYPDEENLIRMGFGAVAHVPIIFSNENDYLGEVNWYLRERATGRHHPNEALKRRRFLARSSIEALARALTNFLTWCEFEEVVWQDASYDDHVLQYRGQMENGEWSEDGHPLAPRTFEKRVDYVCQLMTWAASKGLRNSFEFPVVETNRTIRSGENSRSVVQKSKRRADRRRMNPIDLRLPTEDELERWLSSIKIRHAYSKHLLIRFIIHTGCRISEATSFRTEDLPDEQNARIVNGWAKLLLVHGTKGNKSRLIDIPVVLYKELNSYKKFRRLKALKAYRDRNPKALDPEELFLSDYYGTPLSNRTIQSAWEYQRPFEGFTPHSGRHVWACFTLLDYFRSNLDRNLHDDVIHDVGVTAIGTIIKPQLGHIDENTTQIYLRWAMNTLLSSHYQIKWHEKLMCGGHNDEK